MNFTSRKMNHFKINSVVIATLFNFTVLFKKRKANFVLTQARVAQLVEHNLAKVGVAGSNPVSRSTKPQKCGVFIF